MPTSDAYIKGKTKDEILQELPDTAQVGSPVHEQQKMGILVRCMEDLEQRISDRIGELTGAITLATRESAGLSSKLLFLNRILAAATVVGAIATALALLRQLRLF